jgi:hypothetical protein
MGRFSLGVHKVGRRHTSSSGSCRTRCAKLWEIERCEGRPNRRGGPSPMVTVSLLLTETLAEVARQFTNKVIHTAP